MNLFKKKDSCSEDLKRQIRDSLQELNTVRNGIKVELDEMQKTSEEIKSKAKRLQKMLSYIINNMAIVRKKDVILFWKMHPDKRTRDVLKAIFKNIDFSAYEGREEKRN